MQYAKDLHIFPDSSVEDEMVFKAGNRHDTHTLEIVALKRPGTPHAWQRDNLRTGHFQCRHKTRSRLRIIDPDIFSNL
jgi:hypothetical protein